MTLAELRDPSLDPNWFNIVDACFPENSTVNLPKSATETIEITTDQYYATLYNSSGLSTIYDNCVPLSQREAFCLTYLWVLTNYDYNAQFDYQSALLGYLTSESQTINKLSNSQAYEKGTQLVPLGWSANSELMRYCPFYSAYINTLQGSVLEGGAY